MFTNVVNVILLSKYPWISILWPLYYANEVNIVPSYT